LLFAKEAFPLAAGATFSWCTRLARLAAAANLIICNFASAATLDAKFYRLLRRSLNFYMCAANSRLLSYALRLLFCCRPDGAKVAWMNSCQMALYLGSKAMLPIAAGK
jgi:hypothetical protein